MYTLLNSFLSPTVVKLAILATCVVLFSIYRKHSHRARLLPFPPGPPGFPIIGNIRDLPTENETAAYGELARKYGDLVYMRVFGKHILILNSYAAVTDLFERRSANYSDRGTSTMIQLMGWDFSFGHMRYGERWKAHRKMFRRQFQPSVVSNYWPIQLKEAHSLLHRLLHSPDDFINHLRHNASATIMATVYGISVEATNNRYVEVAEHALDGMAKAASPGAFLVDIFPWLRFVAEWCPGASFQRKAREWREAVIEMRDSPFHAVQNALMQGKASPCFITYALEDFDPKGDLHAQTEVLRNCAGMAYAASTESLVSALSCFFLAMILHPDVQEEAHKELDAIVGRERLPSFQDIDSLPYIGGIVKELLRWNPVAPLGLPHMTTNDDTYRGYHIPAGTTVLGNSWAILHDEEIFPEPGRFNPRRFVSAPTTDSQPSPQLNALNVAFGYGRRICPGRHMAEAHLWIHVASILSVFEIESERDENGWRKRTEASFSSGFISLPLPFGCSINPRGKYVEQLLEHAEF